MAADTLYFPPGSRLGIVKPDGLVPFMGDPRNLQPGDYTFKVEFSEPPRFDDEQDGRIGNGRDDTRRLWEKRLGQDEERRLFAMTSFEGDENYRWLVLVIRKPGWFGQLDVSTFPVGAVRGGLVARWAPVADAIIASAQVRAPLSVADFLDEHRIAMATDGLNPRHFGTKLALSLDPPATPFDAWDGDCYIAMENPPRPIRANSPAERDAMVAEQIGLMRDNARLGPWTVWRSHGIDWIMGGERELIESIQLYAKSAEGFGADRHVELRAYCRGPNRRPTMDLLERTARSFRFFDAA